METIKSFLAIDPGRRCGWAVADAKSPVVYGAWDLKDKPGQSVGMTWLRFRSILQEVISARPRPLLVVYEDVKAHKGSQAAHIYGAIKSNITAEVETFGQDSGIFLTAVGVGTWKRLLAGKGNASKAEYIAASRAKWKIPQEMKEDEAAAMGMLYWAITEYRRRP